MARRVNVGNRLIDSDDSLSEDPSSCSSDSVTNELMDDTDELDDEMDGPIDDTDECINDMHEPVNDMGDTINNMDESIYDIREIIDNKVLLCGILSVETVQAEMARINMDDDEEILARIGEAIPATTQNLFSFDASDEIALGMSQNADNPELSMYKTRQSMLLSFASTNRCKQISSTSIQTFLRPWSDIEIASIA